MGSNNFVLGVFPFLVVVGVGVGIQVRSVQREVTFSSVPKAIDVKLGPKMHKQSRWFGNRPVSSDLPILILAGHADSQGIDGAGTAGEAVDLKGFSPMDATMSDELFWNLKVCRAVVQLGREVGLNISFYDPQIRTISDANHVRTNWSVGANHAKQGGYPLELHFDSYGEFGFGTGLIPPLSTQINNVDESLARTFGRYPLFFRGGLGGPRREIRILEIGKLEGRLESDLRDIQTRAETVQAIAGQIVQAIVNGIKQQDSFNPKLPADDIFLQDSDL